MYIYEYYINLYEINIRNEKINGPRLIRILYEQVSFESYGFSLQSSSSYIRFAPSRYQLQEDKRPFLALLFNIDMKRNFRTCLRAYCFVKPNSVEQFKLLLCDLTKSVPIPVRFDHMTIF